MAELGAQWRRIEAWMRRWAPEALEELRPPAPREAIDALEQAIGAALPTEYRDWLSLHDGAGFHGPFRDELLSASKSAEDWASLKSFAEQHELPEVPPGCADPGVRAIWWTAGWIPFTADGAGNSLCLDLEPDAGGARGQIVEYRHDHEGRPRVAAGMADFLRQHADALEAGEAVACEHDDGAFSGILLRAQLTNSLAELRVRGESPEARAARYEEFRPHNHSERLLVALRDRGLLRVPKLTPAWVQAWMAMKEALREPASPEVHAAAIRAALAARVAPADLRCTEAELRAMLEALAATGRIS